MALYEKVSKESKIHDGDVIRVHDKIALVNENNTVSILEPEEYYVATFDEWYCLYIKDKNGYLVDLSKLEREIEYIVLRHTIPGKVKSKDIDEDKVVNPGEWCFLLQTGEALNGFKAGELVFVEKIGYLKFELPITVYNTDGVRGYTDFDNLKLMEINDIVEIVLPKGKQTPVFGWGDCEVVEGSQGIIKDINRNICSVFLEIPGTCFVGDLTWQGAFEEVRYVGAFAGNDYEEYNEEDDFDEIPVKDVNGNEILPGDIVKFTQDTGAYDFKAGSFAEIKGINFGGIKFGLDGEYLGNGNWIQLVVPGVERWDVKLD